MKKCLLVVAGWLAGMLPAHAQSATPQPVSWETIFFDSPAVALPLLTNAVLGHSAQLRMLNINKLSATQDVKLARKNILNSVALGGTYSYGNLSGIGVPDPGNPNQFNTFNASRYSTGVTVSVSLAQLLGRHNLLEREQLNLDHSETARQDREDQLRQLTIQLYQNVVLAHKLLLLQQQAYVTVQSTYTLTEKHFRKGEVSLPEIAAANAQLTTASITQETARNQYETAFMLLEEVAGAKISSIISTHAPQ